MSDRTQDLKNLRAVATACKNYVDETKEQILWQVGQYDITTQDDNTIAYQKVVPTGATRVKIKSIGGMSYKSENLCILQDIAETTTSGITYKAENGIITLTGTNTSSGAIGIVFNFNEFNGTYGMLLDGYKNVFQNGVQIRLSGTYVDTIATNEDSKVLSNKNFDEIRLIVASGMTINATIKPMIVSGSTAPTEYKPYFAGIRDSVVTSIVASGSDVEPITYNIPSEIQALDGFGVGLTNYTNVVDFESKKYIQNSYKENISQKILNVIDTLTFRATSGGYEIGADGGWLLETINGIITNPFEITNSSNVYNNTNNYLISNSWLSLPSTYDTKQKYIDYLTTNTIWVVVQKSTPIETDISSYIDGTTILDVEGGGSLEFTNTYNQAVPSNVTYRIEVAR